MQAMAYRLTTQTRRAAYTIRKPTVEPVFGIIKSVMGLRQFSSRGLCKVTGEWNLVCLAWPGLECEAHGRPTPKSWIRGGKTVRKLPKRMKQVRSACFLTNCETCRVFESLSPIGC
jgi:hypothetical protein